MHDDNDDDFRRQNYERLFGTPDEREVEAREMAERQAKIKQDETLEWARQRAEAREAERQQRPVVEKTYSEQAKATKHWQQYIREQLDQRERVMLKVIAQMAVDEERRSERAAAEIKQIIFDVRDRFDAMEARAAEVAALRAEVAELRVAVLRRTEAASDDEARKRAGEIRRAQQQVDRLRVA